MNFQQSQIHVQWTNVKYLDTKRKSVNNRFFILCSENGHFLNTLLFLLRLLKSFTFIVHKPVIYSLFIYIHISKL
ncbi:hypothetical protein BUI56_11495 [Lactococcus lactis subsp. lactis]|nr:hypothetical protein BUI56_11495 [Lactococcus lactis subsp. lactis]RQE17463.1 hypothetical protein D6114_10720 [Lactococcus lactis]RQE21953.1 hypothetical protein D6112_10510 [Lactococcus lactis]RQE28130.1 hypothetical protein D6119_05880 [Lactococcus lactis]